MRVLDMRATSAFPLSIATSFALESMFEGPNPPFDPTREKPPAIDPHQYQAFWINVATIYRNLLDSVSSTEERNKLLPGDILDFLIYELETIKDVVNHFTQGRLPVVFYHSRYEGMKSAHPWAKLRIPSTTKQLRDRDIRDAVLTPLIKNHTKDFQLRIFKRALETTEVRQKVLILTHYAYDLLSSRKFDDLHLLESHTGLLKKHASFYTKLSNSKDLVRIPFNMCTIQVFGDSQTFFGFPPEVKHDILQLSELAKWNAMTTSDRVRLGISTLKDRLTADILIKMLGEQP
jgi:hypothetical protein